MKNGLKCRCDNELLLHSMLLSDANMELDLKSASETRYFVPPTYLKFRQECFARF